MDKITVDMTDPTTIGINCSPECPECGAHDTKLDDAQPPFRITSIDVVIPIVCNKCFYSFSIQFKLEQT